MKYFRELTNSAFYLFLSLSMISCSGENPALKIGIHHSKLAICPSSPNCVSSDATDPDHYIEPFLLTATPAEAWRVVQAIVAAEPNTKIITAESNYLHAECRSDLFGFVDDLEMHLRPAETVIAIRSASRLGYFDFGVNRKRLERLRSELSGKGLIE
jgi:uncharacterized protein (DUF1499 family)